MSQMELYHLHKINHHDKLWRVNKEINVNKNFKSTMLDRYNNFTTSVSVDDGSKVMFYQALVACINAYNSGYTEELNNLMKISYDIIFKAGFFKRETALENFRKDNNNNLPSRLNSMYFTDEKGIDVWKTKLEADKSIVELYRVLVEGNIFKTNELLIPDETLSYSDAYSKAYKYWNPNFKNVPDDSNEYLVQGKIKILEKIS